jgi:hypothetical protein
MQRSSSHKTQVNVNIQSTNVNKNLRLELPAREPLISNAIVLSMILVDMTLPSGT